MVARKLANLYSLKKSKKVLRRAYRLYLRKRKRLDAISKEKIQHLLTSLQRAILERNAPFATQIAHQVEESSQKLMPKTLWDRTRDFVGAIFFALIIAIAIRQMWFELYVIPTGSMRPTLKESDLLAVSKTDFGINFPLRPGHFYFDPTLVKRGDIFVFTSEGMDIEDSDTTYFFLFPGKKQFVKRLVAKPGDALYFYGGQIYGIDSQGRELKTLIDPPWFQEIEHIPFIRFDGTVETPGPPHRGIFPKAVFYQMHLPVAEMSVNPFGVVSGKMLPVQGHTPLPNYGELWGFRNYAMAKLLTRRQVDEIHPSALKDLEPGVLYLELQHHPNLHRGHLVRDEQNRYRPDFSLSVSLLPLQKKQLDAIFKHMTTCRFQVKDGLAFRLGMNPHSPYARYFPRFPHVPDGTYEFQNGQAFQIYSLGIAKKLPPEHPLYQNTPETVQLLYNLGFEFLTHYNPYRGNHLFSSRYAYFRNRDLYLLGAPIIKKEDPNLILFLKREYQKQSISTSINPYVPFDDTGPPLTKEGTIDVDFIRKYGLVIPEKSYLALGDNHAMSADSRQFGFVPQANLRGGPFFLFWPPGSRWGGLPQPTHSIITFPNLVIWGSAAAIALVCSIYLRRKFYRPLKFEGRNH